MKALAMAFLLLLAGCASHQISHKISAKCSQNEIDELLETRLKALLKSQNSISLACESLEFSGAGRGLIYYTGLENGGYAKHVAQVDIIDKDKKPLTGLKITNKINQGAYELDKIVQKTADEIILNLKEKQWI
ncbi:hypothetical protein [Campylobacter sp. 19-13652]|uniref:hypothetical protein n=1 Tax=Campylobacter sp. 19-13652 TaxID=2840180 RepID=UPI001C779F9E|nr:hypothetical protein [Campylobacter sp. 19-13652]BCX79058.1 hypothetical protein LBC_05200 [Campylobacter sp. 19-13652]